MSKASDLNEELLRIQRKQDRLRDELFRAIRKHGSERASEAMAEADEAIREAVELAVEDEPFIDEWLTDSNVISRLARRVFPRKSKL